MADIPIKATFTGTITLDGVLHIDGPVIPPHPPRFEVGVTYPDEGVVGAGVILDYPTKVVTQKTIFDGEPIEPVVNTVFKELVQVKSDGWHFINCSFRGPAQWVSGGQLVWVDQTKVSPEGKPRFTYCDFNPQSPDPHWNGVGWKLYRLEMCHLWGMTDGCAIFARSDDPDPRVYVEVIGTWIEKLSQFKPDINRDVTHNDGAQLQGNKGPADDAFFDGCRVDAYHSPDQSNPLPPEHTQISAFMLSPNQQDRVCLTVRRSWLGGGVFTFNGTSSTNALSQVVLEENRWERPRNGGPSAAIALDKTLASTISMRDNTYSDDGSPVPVYVS